jgi:hypothetical protein
MAIVDFGVTNKVNITFGRILGAFEGILAIALALKVYPRVTLTITAMLLWVFGSLIFRSLLLGKDFACFCFGDIDSNLSRWTLLRTLALASLATTVAYFPTPDNLHTSLEADVMQAIVAISPLGIVVLISQIVRLLRMEVNPQFNSKERKMKTNK